MNGDRKRGTLGKDKRRKHHHFEVKIFYNDGEVFARRYTDPKRAVRFAKRQRKSPVVRRPRAPRFFLGNEPRLPDFADARV